VRLLDKKPFGRQREVGSLRKKEIEYLPANRALEMPVPLDFSFKPHLPLVNDYLGNQTAGAQRLKRLIDGRPAKRRILRRQRIVNVFRTGMVIFVLWVTQVRVHGNALRRWTQPAIT